MKLRSLRKKRIVNLTILILILGLVVSGCSPSSNSGDTSNENGALEDDLHRVKEQRINIATATTGGGYYPIGTTIAQMLTENLEGLNASASTSSGSAENIDIVDRGEAQIAINQDNVLYPAFHGIEKFEGEPHEDIRLVAPLLVTPHYILTRNSANVNKIEDLEGKKFSVGPPGSGTEVSVRNILSAFGLSLDDITPEYLGQSEAVDALKNKQIDGAYLAGGTPHPSVTDYFMTPGADGKIHSFSDEELDIILDKFDFFSRTTVPAGTYKNIDYDIETTANASHFVSTEELLDTDTAYKIIKNIYDNRDELIKILPLLDNHAFHEPWNFIGVVPLHSGLEKYLKEIGKWEE